LTLESLASVSVTNRHCRSCEKIMFGMALYDRKSTSVNCLSGHCYHTKAEISCRSCQTGSDEMVRARHNIHHLHEMSFIWEATLFRSLSILREHVRPGYPHTIKSCEPYIICSRFYDECIRYRATTCLKISLASPSLWVNFASGDSWETD
jgi:hypothetical protein